jgi:hypothetical protein
MDALNQQNSVLERDIHTCNFERINLTRQLHESKEKLEKLQLELNRQMMERSNKPRKSLFPVLSKDDVGSQAPASRLKNSALQGNSSAAQFGRGISNKTLADLKSGPFLELPEESEEYQEQTNEPVRSSVGAVSGLQQKKKGFAYINGRLERRFNVNK